MEGTGERGIFQIASFIKIIITRRHWAEKRERNGFRTESVYVETSRNGRGGDDH